jgi:hypothetical protein
MCQVGGHVKYIKIIPIPNWITQSGCFTTFEVLVQENTGKCEDVLCERCVGSITYTESYVQIPSLKLTLMVR